MYIEMKAIDDSPATIWTLDLPNVVGSKTCQELNYNEWNFYRCNQIKIDQSLDATVAAYMNDDHDDDDDDETTMMTRRQRDDYDDDISSSGRRLRVTLDNFDMALSVAVPRLDFPAYNFVGSKIPLHHSLI